jgi:signal transduction histidine kinase
MDTVRESLSHLQPMPLAPVSVAGCVACALDSTQLPAGVSVQVADLTGLPPVVAHPRGLTLVFTNLLENAADAIEGAGTVTISGSNCCGWVEVVVRDSGPGIPAELHEQIFEISFSGRGAPRANKLGFGLWWVRTLMTRLGGAILVESDGQHGATFKLRLPCAEGMS